MTHDICHYYPKTIEQVYIAYQRGIKQAFNKDAEGQHPHTLVFGLNFSFKYNMNGGGCHVHFMPYQNGTAVNVHYTIAQAVGAKCKAHDKDLTREVERFLGASASDLHIDTATFAQYKNNAAAPAAPVAPVVPVAPAVPVAAVAHDVPVAPVSPAASAAPKAKFCSNCGAPFGESSLFCSNCGAKRK